MFDEPDDPPDYDNIDPDAAELVELSVADLHFAEQDPDLAIVIVRLI